jgi:hypothetical protein
MPVHDSCSLGTDITFFAVEITGLDAVLTAIADKHGPGTPSALDCVLCFCTYALLMSNDPECWRRKRCPLSKSQAQTLGLGTFARGAKVRFDRIAPWVTLVDVIECESSCGSRLNPASELPKPGRAPARDSLFFHCRKGSDEGSCTLTSLNSRTLMFAWKCFCISPGHRPSALAFDAPWNT